MIEGVQLQRYEEQMNSLADCLYGAGMENEVQYLVRDEGKRLVTICVRLTPPFGRGGTAAGAKEAGEQAISREISSIMSQAEPDTIYEIGHRYGYTAIDTFWTERDGTRLHVKWDLLNPSGSKMAQVHKANRSTRGKIKPMKRAPGVWAAKIVVEKGNLVPYIRAIQAKVGKWKASIGYALPFLGQNVPNWIRRHFGEVSDISILDLSRIQDPKHPEFVFGTRAPGVGEPAYNYPAQVHHAVEVRIKALATRCRMILRRHGNEISNGWRPLPLKDYGLEAAPVLE